MSDRNMSSAMLTELAQQGFMVAHLAELHFSTIQYLTDSGMDIVWNGHTYTDTEGLVSMDTAGETFALEVGTLSFTLSGTELANLSIALTDNFTDAQVVIRRALIQPGSSPIVIASPVILWDGRIDSWDYSENPSTGQSTITWKTSNHWVDFNRVSGRRTNSADQQLFYSGDLGLQYADQVPLNIQWPSASSSITANAAPSAWVQW